MTTRLSAGALTALMNGETIQRPVVQLVALKQLQTPAPNGGNSERYRLMLSDGVNSCVFVMLATQLNFLVANGQLSKFSVISLHEYVLNRPMPSKKVLVILDLLILQTGSLVGRMIGNPVPITCPSREIKEEPQVPDSTTDFTGTPNARDRVEPLIIKLEPSARPPPMLSVFSFYQDRPASARVASKRRAEHSAANSLGEGTSKDPDEAARHPNVRMEELAKRMKDASERELSNEVVKLQRISQAAQKLEEAKKHQEARVRELREQVRIQRQWAEHVRKLNEETAKQLAREAEALQEAAEANGEAGSQHAGD